MRTEIFIGKATEGEVSYNPELSTQEVFCRLDFDAIKSDEDFDQVLDQVNRARALFNAANEKTRARE